MSITEFHLEKFYKMSWTKKVIVIIEYIIKSVEYITTVMCDLLTRSRYKTRKCLLYFFSKQVGNVSFYITKLVVKWFELVSIKLYDLRVSFWECFSLYSHLLSYVKFNGFDVTSENTQLNRKRILVVFLVPGRLWT